MELEINKLNFHRDDHCWVENTIPSEYIDDYKCDGCNHAMTDVVCVQNSEGEVGISQGLCENCGYIKTTRNLRHDVLNKHFSNKWLNLRTVDDFKVVDSVYKIIEPYIDQNRHKRVLDVGCGNGDKLSYFEKMGFETFGVEPSESRTDSARKHLKKSNIHTGFSEEYLKSADKGFDIICIENVMQFTSNPFLLFNLAAEKLNNGGLLYIRAQRFDYSSFPMFSMLSLIRSYVSLYSLKEHIKKHNLNVVTFSEKPFVLVLRKGDGLNDETVRLLENTDKITLDHVGLAAQKGFSSKISRLTGLVTLKNKSMKRSMSFKILDRHAGFPIKIKSRSKELPIILK